jgi:hypothetical protein
MKTLQLFLALLLVQACGQSPYDVVVFQQGKDAEVTSANASEYDTPEIPYYKADESIPHCDSETEGEVIYWAKTEAYYNCLLVHSLVDTTAPGGINELAEESQRQDGAWVKIPNPAKTDK